EQFVTLFFARLDPRGRSLVYASAGHPPGFLLTAVGEVKAELRSTDTVLGLIPEGAFATAPALPLAPGDLLLFCTDGVLEARSPEGTYFGTDRAPEVVRAHCHRGAQEIAVAICEAAREFYQGRRQNDDITAVVVKVGGPAL